jgi:inorganic phosphate transporter, PiT family
VSLTLLLVLGAGFLVAHANGANDVSKGVATLVGSGVTDYERALRWGTLCTALGALAGGAFARAMLVTFGSGFLAAGVEPTFAGALAALLGAAGWVLIATRAGLPVSTTHAIVGSLIGVACVAHGPAGVSWAALGDRIALPLALSPLAALALTVASGRVAGGEPAAPDCLCLEPAPPALASATGSTVLMSAGAHVRVDRTEACAVAPPGSLRLTLDGAHWLTSGATSFARGMNDGPKIVALMLAASALALGAPVPTWALFAVVTAGMVAGSLAGGRRVTEVLAERVTRMDHRSGFVANLVTAALVAAGAVGGLPMSTTHVASGAIVGTGRGAGTIRWRTVRDLLLAWLVTLPAAGALAVAAFALARCIPGLR